MKSIEIPKKLRDYIEMLQYEAARYDDLLRTVYRDIVPMTDEEWKSSLEHFQTLRQEAYIKLNTAKEFIEEEYKDEICGQPWHIFFGDSTLNIGSSEVTKTLSGQKWEQYQDRMRRYYPETEFQLGINDTFTKDITLQVTDACNMACTYCYQHAKAANSMSFETAKQTIDLLLDSDERVNNYITLDKVEGVVINFIGGEPWLEIDLITKATDYFIGELFRRKHRLAIRFFIGVCSNGLLHFDQKVQDYLHRHLEHMSYSISIDGNKSLHDACRVDLAGNGTYDRAIAAVNQTREAFKYEMGSKMTIAPGNVDKLYEAVTYMIESNHYDNINLNCVYEEGWTKGHATTLYYQLKEISNWLVEKNLLGKIYLSILDDPCGVPRAETDDANWCGGNGLMLATDFRGDLYPCLRYMESSLGNNAEPYLIGDIKTGIGKCKKYQDRLDCLSCVTWKSQNEDKCLTCPIAKGCGGCTAYNYEIFGTPNKRATYICDMHIARSLAVMYYNKLKGEDFEMHCPKDWALKIIPEKEYDFLLNMKVGE